MTRLKLRDDAYYAPTSDGICILTNSGDVVLTGPSIYQWVDRLAPYLDGRHTLAELTASMPAERKAMTERVVTALHERGVVVEAEDGGDVEPLLTDHERRLYGREIGLLGSFGPSAQSRFHAFRDSPVALVGSGRMLVETLAAALCSGSRRLRVAVTEESPTDTTRLAECERHARQRDPDQQIARIALDLSDEDGLTAVVGGAGIVVYASDRPAVEHTRALDRACAGAGAPFVAAILAGGEAWLGPFGLANGERVGWMAAWRRLLALGGSNGAIPGPGGPPAGASPTVVANQLVREVLWLLSGASEQTGPARMTRVELPSLRTQRHRFRPHPFAVVGPEPDQAARRGTVDRLRTGSRIDAEEFSQRVTACLDARIGVLGEVTEHNFRQVPLAVSQVRVSDPVGLLGPDTPRPVVTGADLSLTDARRKAVLGGLAAYGSLMVDPRRLHVRPGGADPRTGDPDRDLATLLAGEWDGLVWGHGLADGRPHDVAVGTVFPALCGARSNHVVPPGAAAGYDWDEAVRTGLIGQCRQLTLTEVGEGRHRFTPIQWDGIALDERARRYRSLVTLIGEGFGVFDVTGSAGVPTLAFCLDDATLAYASGLSFADALRDGLAQVLLSHQAQAAGEAGYAPAEVPPLPTRRRLSRVAAGPAWSTDVATVAAGLAQLGWTAVAVPLDHDPGVTAGIMPYLVHVVLTRA